jgi:hypothetical protein
MSAAKLRLGPLPKANRVKLTVTMTAELNSALERYAELHSQLHGEKTDAAMLIPHMLAAFMARDRGFRKQLAAKSAS